MSTVVLDFEPMSGTSWGAYGPDDQLYVVRLNPRDGNYEAWAPDMEKELGRFQRRQTAMRACANHAKRQEARR